MSKLQLVVLAGIVMALSPLHAGADDGSKVLEQADRDFGRAAAERGLEGWMSFFAADAIRLPKIGDKMVKGAAAVRKVDAALFANPNRRLVWEPVDAHLFADGKTGVTTGRFKGILKDAQGSEKTVSTGSYITGWRKEADGNWKVTFDTGTTDAVAPPKK